MPLSSKINTASSESRNKRTKTESKKITRTRSTANAIAAAAAAAADEANQANNSNTSSTENEEPLSSLVAKANGADNAASIILPLNELSTNDKTEEKMDHQPVKTINSVADNNNDSNSTSNLTSTTNNLTNFEDTMMTDATNNTVEFDPSAPKIQSNRRTLPGSVLAVGENLSNQLGMGLDVSDRKKPQLIRDLPKNIVQVAAGGMHSACLSEDGIVYTFGCNDEFALGRDNDEDIDKVDLPEKSIEITAGDSHCAALSETGVVYAWGTFRDGSGVLGLEQKKIAKTPMKFKLREKIAKISSGADHLVFLTTTGEVYTAGNSEHGQLGRISKYNSCRGGRRGCDMILVPGLVRIAKKKELHGIKKIEDIWTSAYCTYLQVKDLDLVIAFGLNNCYQLGAEDCENRYQPDIIHSLKFEGKLKKVIGGMHHTLFLDSKGYVYALGSHRYGCLGLGKIDADVNKPARINELVDIIDIAANTNTSYAIDKQGRAFSWGTNYSKQLGQDTEDDFLTPTIIKSKHMDARNTYSVSIGGQHSLVIVSEEKNIDSD